MRILTVVFLILAPIMLCGFFWSHSFGLAKRVAELEAQMERVAELEVQVEELTAALEEAQEILQFVRVETGELGGLRGPHWIIEGANVHVWSGLGQTYPRLCPGGGPDGCVSSNGRGNLIVGYNEVDSTQPTVRLGMHNLVVGPEHGYISNGGFVAGFRNRIEGRSASVTGGANNQATNWFSSVSGGAGNVASGIAASVSGGQDRVAPDNGNWAAGSLFESN
jgi:hypothetical protein